MPLDSKGIFIGVSDVVKRLGVCQTVNTHEPKGAPKNKVSAAIWVQRIAPAINSSGVASTSAVILFNIQIYMNMLQEPQDAIDPLILSTVDTIINAFSKDFDMGLADKSVRCVDLLNAEGYGSLEALAGYVDIDKTLFRCMTITLPIIVNDLWTQEV